ncbi:MAG: PAS domain-containing protein [Candidatus Jettenia sp.]|nr:PAS domain-containing protein [Candidatus Jettenia sp.]
MGKPLRVLIVDDSLYDVDLVLCELRRGGYDPIFERVETASAMKMELERQAWDVVLSEHSMPFFSGIGALMQLQLSKMDLPFIIISGVISGDVVVEYMKAGALDYVRKNNLTSLVASIERALSEAEERMNQRQAEELLRMNESRYRLLLENLPQRIFYKDKNLMYVSCNESLAEDLHIRPDEIYGKTDYEFFPKELAEKYRTGDKRVIESGQAEDREEKYIKDGQELIIRMVKTPMRDEKGDIIGISGIFWDITEKVLLSREAERSRHLASLGELAAGVAHEINNPINGIINCAQILFNESSEGSSEQDLARRIIKEGDRVAGIVHSLLSFSRPNDTKEKKSDVCMHTILSDTLILTKAQLQKEGIQIKVNIPKNLPKIVANPHQIQQVFLNTISNARYALNQKYLKMHDNKILEILGEEIMLNNYPYVKITFYDHGIGIPAHIVHKVMDPFFTTKPRDKGTGLGLSVSHGIVTAHGGKFIIDSVEGEFAKFSIVLPVKPVADSL